MDTSQVEVKRFSGQGYKSLVSFGAWRVAVLRYSMGLHPDRLDTMERHNQTDEVFVLTSGRAMLVLGGNGPICGIISTCVLEPGEINNVRQDTWHTIVISEDAHILIVENGDTGSKNTQYCLLPPDLRADIHRQAVEFITA